MDLSSKKYKFAVDFVNLPPAPNISEEELKHSPLYGFNCCGEIVEFLDLRGLTYGKKT